MRESLTMSNSIVAAVSIITGIALIAGLLLSFAYKRMPADSESLVEKVNQLLPQTQCAQCGYPGCRPYARAIIEKNAATNLCPPGGQETADKLSGLLGREPSILAQSEPSRMHQSVARIDEEFTKHGIAHSFHAYDGAGHAFQNFMNDAGYREEAARPWRTDTLAMSFSTTKGIVATALHVNVPSHRGQQRQISQQVEHLVSHELVRPA